MHQILRGALTIINSINYISRTQIPSTVRPFDRFNTVSALKSLIEFILVLCFPGHIEFPRNEMREMKNNDIFPQHKQKNCVAVRENSLFQFQPAKLNHIQLSPWTARSSLCLVILFCNFFFYHLVCRRSTASKAGNAPSLWMSSYFSRIGFKERLGEAWRLSQKVFGIRAQKPRTVHRFTYFVQLRVYPRYTFNCLWKSRFVKVLKCDTFHIAIHNSQQFY